MGGEFGQPDATPIILVQPEPPKPKPKPAEPTTVKLLVRDEYDAGEIDVGRDGWIEIPNPYERVGSGALVTTLAKSNDTRPSAFRDQLGLDPQQMLDTEDLTAFKLVSSPTVPILRDEDTAIKIRFRPHRTGAISAVANLQLVGTDGSFDTRSVRLVGIGKQRVVNETQTPNVAQGVRPSRPVEAPTISQNSNGAVRSAIAEANRLGDEQTEGVTTAKEEIESFSKAPPPKSEWDWLIDLAISMGVAGIAGVVAKFLAKQMATAVANNAALDKQQPNPSPNNAAEPAAAEPPQEVKASESLVTLVADTVKDGLKTIAKKPPAPRKAPTADTSVHAPENTGISSNEQISFFHEHRTKVLDLKHSYVKIANDLSEKLQGVDPDAATAALMALAHAYNETTPSAAEIQLRATEYQWVSATARRKLGSREQRVPNESTFFTTTNMDGALDFGERGALGVEEGHAPNHDGVLDIDVYVPPKAPFADTAQLQVRAASLMGISQEIADRIVNTDLASSGIPIRVVMHGQPGLITRDEVGNVRVRGFLRMEDAAELSEAHMHKGARIIMNMILSKTLKAWGVAKIETNDATRTKPVGT